MKTGRIRFLLVTIVLLVAACGGGTEGGGLFGTDASGNTVTTDGGGDGGDGGSLLDPAQPLPIREGLGTFNNYVWSIEMTTIGPTVAESSTTTEELSFNRDPESRISRTRTITTGPDIDGGQEESLTEIYQIELESCQWDGESWTHTLATNQQQEVLDAVQRLADVIIVPESAVVIAEETIAGIPATHYQFTVSGFGAESGALVTANQADYWLSASGVVLKYLLVLESWSGPTDDPNSTVYSVVVNAQLLSANQPIPVELSPDCLALPPEDAGS